MHDILTQGSVFIFYMSARSFDLAVDGFQQAFKLVHTVFINLQGVLQHGSHLLDAFKYFTLFVFQAIDYLIDKILFLNLPVSFILI